MRAKPSRRMSICTTSVSATAHSPPRAVYATAMVAESRMEVCRSMPSTVEKVAPRAVRMAAVQNSSPVRAGRKSTAVIRLP